MCLAIPGKIVEIVKDDPMDRIGRVSFAEAVREVNLTCVPEAKAGDFVVVHVGMALSIVDPDEAEKIFEHVKESEEILKNTVRRTENG